MKSILSMVFFYIRSFIAMLRKKDGIKLFLKSIILFFFLFTIKHRAKRRWYSSENNVYAIFEKRLMKIFAVHFHPNSYVNRILTFYGHLSCRCAYIVPNLVFGQRSPSLVIFFSFFCLTLHWHQMEHVSWLVTTAFVSRF